jgi:hypothetical protein
MRFVLRNKTQWTLLSKRPVSPEVLILAAKGVLPELQARATAGHQRTAVEWLSLKVQHFLTMRQCEAEGIPARDVHAALASDPSYNAYMELSETFSLTQARA